MKIKIGMAFIVMAISYYGYNKANSIDFDLPSIKEGKIVISDDNKDKYYKKLPQYIKHDNSNISIFIDYNSKIIRHWS